MPFDLLGCADSIPNEKRTLDEVSQYNLAHIDSVPEKGEEFLPDDYVVMKFWYDRGKTFRNLFALLLEFSRI